MSEKLRAAEKWHSWLPEGFGIQVVRHNVLAPEQRSSYSPPAMWNTYLLFSDKVRFSRDNALCDPYREVCPIVERIWDDLSIVRSLEGWNGGVTFEERLVSHPLGDRRIKIGDDYQHLWDSEFGAWDHYGLPMMERRIRRVAAELIERLQLKPEAP